MSCPYRAAEGDELEGALDGEEEGEAGVESDEGVADDDGGAMVLE